MGFRRPGPLPLVLVALGLVVSSIVVQVCLYAKPADVTGYSGLLMVALAVTFCLWTMSPLKRRFERLSPWKVYLLTPLLLGSLCAFFYLFGELVDQPHGWNLRSYELNYALKVALHFGCLLAAMSTVFIFLDAIRQPAACRDLIYFPTLSSVLRSGQTRAGKLILIVGLVVVCGYYGLTIASLARQQALHRGIWPPDRVFFSCMTLWGFLWLADCWSRPHKGTIISALGFLALCCWALPMLGFDVLRGG